MTAFLHSYADPAKDESAFVHLVGAEGTRLHGKDGRTYLDAMASLWYCQVGHGRREIIDAVTRQMNEFSNYHTFDPFTHGPAVEVSERIAGVSPWDDPRVFLACSGSEAVDTALKMMRLVHQRRAGETAEARQIIVRRERGYHGVNFGGTTAQGIAANREGWGDMVPHFVEVPGDDLEAMASLFAEQGDKIAGVITEPLQGAGGVFPPPPGYLEGLRRMCDDHGALLCFDEVIAGFGRTGEWFASQTYGVTPDLLTFAKGVTSGYLPLSGVIVGDSISRELEDFGAMFRHGYTYSGHAASCAAGLANIDIIENEGLVAKARELHRWFENGLSALVSDGTIQSYRGHGGVWAADIARDSIPVRDRMLAEQGVVVRGIGEAIAMCPPLIATEDEVGEILDAMVACL